MVKPLCVSSEEAGNPFEDDGGCLFSLDSKVIIDAAAMTAVSSVISSGIQQYNNFVEERLEKRTKPIKKPLRKNKLHVFVQNGRLKNLPLQSSATAARCFRGFTLHARQGKETCQNFSGTKTSHHHSH